jgi:hypothetical protein
MRHEPDEPPTPDGTSRSIEDVLPDETKRAIDEAHDDGRRARAPQAMTRYWPPWWVWLVAGWLVFYGWLRGWPAD